MAVRKATRIITLDSLVIIMRHTTPTLTVEACLVALVEEGATAAGSEDEVVQEDSPRLHPAPLVKTPRTEVEVEDAEVVLALDEVDSEDEAKAISPSCAEVVHHLWQGTRHLTVLAPRTLHSIDLNRPASIYGMRIGPLLDRDERTTIRGITNDALVALTRTGRRVRGNEKSSGGFWKRHERGMSGIERRSWKGLKRGGRRNSVRGKRRWRGLNARWRGCSGMSRRTRKRSSEMWRRALGRCSGTSRGMLSGSSGTLNGTLSASGDSSRRMQRDGNGSSDERPRGGIGMWTLLLYDRLVNWTEVEGRKRRQCTTTKAQRWCYSNDQSDRQPTCA